MIALAAISFGSVYAAPGSTMKTDTTTKMKKKKEYHEKIMLHDRVSSDLFWKRLRCTG